MRGARTSGDYWVVSTYDGLGGIHGEDGETLATFRGGPREFLFLDPSGARCGEATRERAWYSSSWTISSGGSPEYQLSRTSYWFGKYSLDSSGGEHWTLRFPPFKLWYTASSTTGGAFCVRLVNHTQWYVQGLTVAEPMPILDGLAIVQRQRQWA